MRVDSNLKIIKTETGLDLSSFIQTNRNQRAAKRESPGSEDINIARRNVHDERTSQILRFE
jgi:hypothetical protein